MERPAFNRGLEQLTRLDLTYDVLIYAHQLPEATRLVDRHPEQRFVLDHGAKPPIAKGEIMPWREDLQDLARRPNVTCKLSGLVTEADWKTWMLDALPPHILTRACRPSGQSDCWRVPTGLCVWWRAAIGAGGKLCGLTSRNSAGTSALLCSAATRFASTACRRVGRPGVFREYKLKPIRFTSHALWVCEHGRGLPVRRVAALRPGDDTLLSLGHVQQTLRTSLFNNSGSPSRFPPRRRNSSRRRSSSATSSWPCRPAIVMRRRGYKTGLLIGLCPLRHRDAALLACRSHLALLAYPDGLVLRGLRLRNT